MPEEVFPLQSLLRGSLAAVIHWNYEPGTSHGPALGIKPRQRRCIR